MRIRTLAAAAAVSALLSTVTATPAFAATDFPITVTPALGHPTEAFTVTGDATDPVCAEDGVVVNLFYHLPDGSGAAASVNTVTDAAGHFTADLAIPENAVAGMESSVSAVIADCTPPSEPTISRASTSVPFDIQAYVGTFVVDKTTGKPGQVVHFSGTNCWGNAIAVTFGTASVTGVTLNPDRTFSGTYVLPDVTGATYDFVVTCPGTSFPVRSLRLVNPVVVVPPAAPPATPVTGPAHFTG